MKRIDRNQIIIFLDDYQVDLKPTQQKLSIPIIDRLYRKMLVGIKFPPIKVDTDIICDGHHRYIASKLAKINIENIASVVAPSTSITNWQSISFEQEDWDTPAKINLFNVEDANYNNIPLIKLMELLEE